MKKIIFEYRAFEDFNEWLEKDKKIHQKVIKLIKEVIRSPFSGVGKPEAMRHELSGYWSRRIDDEHRLVYKFTEEAVIVISCKNHY